MELYHVEALSLLLLFLLIIPPSIDHKEDIRYFDVSISKTPVCASWACVSCNGKRVTMLRLPGIGLYGRIPPNTSGNLDALTILSLHSNFLNRSLPSNLLSLPSLSSTGY
ncbi:probable inactive receptor kinase, partial [Tanacetum coccineum]